MSKPQRKPKAPPVKKASKAKAVKPTATKQVLRIPLDQLVPGKQQARANITDESVEELAESIKRKQLYPIKVRKKGRKYEIIDGERRWRAAKLAKLKTIAAIVDDVTDDEAEEDGLVANRQREDYTHMELARALKKRLDRGLTQAEAGKTLGISQETVSNYVSLLRLPSEIQKHVNSRKIPFGHGWRLAMISDAKAQQELAQKIIQDKLSVRLLERAIRKVMWEGKQDAAAQQQQPASTPMIPKPKAIPQKPSRTPQGPTPDEQKEDTELARNGYYITQPDWGNTWGIRRVQPISGMTGNATNFAFDASRQAAIVNGREFPVFVNAVKQGIKNCNINALPGFTRKDLEIHLALEKEYRTPNYKTPNCREQDISATYGIDMAPDDLGEREEDPQDHTKVTYRYEEEDFPCEFQHTSGLSDDELRYELDDEDVMYIGAEYHVFYGIGQWYQLDVAVSAGKNGVKYVRRKCYLYGCMDVDDYRDMQKALSGEYVHPDEPELEALREKLEELSDMLDGGEYITKKEMARRRQELEAILKAIK